MGGETSSAVIVVTLAAAAATLYAFWMSIRRGRAFRRLVRWVRDRHPERWAALPRRNRWLNEIGAIERLRRDQFADDAQFMSLHGEVKRYRRRQIVFIAIGVALIGVLALGVRYFGWRW